MFIRESFLPNFFNVHFDYEVRGLKISMLQGDPIMIYSSDMEMARACCCV